MNKLQFLRQCKAFLLLVVKTRQDLIDHKKGKATTDSMIEVMALIKYWVPKMDSFDRIERFIYRTKIRNGVREIIPSRNKKWYDKFEMFLRESDRLKQPATQLN
jgi:hypothetical protein